MYFIRKNLTKYLSILFSTLLITSHFFIPHAEASNSHQSSNDISNYLSKSNEQSLTDEYDPTDRINIVIELKHLPTVLHANSINKTYSELSKDTKVNLHQKMIKEQNEFKKMTEAKNIDIRYIDNFTAIFNGLSAEIQYKDLEKIKNLKVVKDVYISQEYEPPVDPPVKSMHSDETPEANSASEVVNAPIVWEDYGYKGEGMVVAVLDRGVDVEHQDLVLSDSTDPALKKEDVEEIIATQDVEGAYYTEKVPFGYNYADKNNIVKNIGEGVNHHGMHVTGIVGANGDVENGGIKGIAPEVQILAMKVYSNDQVSSTGSHIYVKAIDDAVKLGADAINMSFGATARVINPNDPAHIAIQRATENGIIVSKSAGNGYYFGNDFDYVLAANPDLSVSSSPQMADGSIAVANFENTHLNYPAFQLIDDDDQFVDLVAYRPASSAPSPDEAIDREGYEVVYVGYGRMPGDSDKDPDANDFKGIDLEGKIALIKRGETSFVNKTLNAQSHGAVAVIVFNNVDDPQYASMSSDPAVEIPQVFILKNDGEKILENIDHIKIAFKDDRLDIKNPRTGQMARSTAWGSPRLDLMIPAISGVGTEVLSTLNDNAYGIKSGTSMAAPQIAGGSVLLKSKLIEESMERDELNITLMTKNILMNTAVPIENISETSQELGIEGIPYSPRRQGAGLMDLHAAIKTPVVIKEVNSELAGIALGELEEQFTFTLELQNLSDKVAVYNVDTNVQTDLGEDKYHLLESIDVIGKNGEIPVTYSSDHGTTVDDQYQITVPTQETILLDISVDLSDAVDGYLEKPLKEIFINGQFIEGFVTFTDPNDQHPTLSVPYVGFYGDWNEPPILDEFIYDPENSYYNLAGMVTDLDQDEYPYLGIDPVTDKPKANYAISPKGEGTYDNIIPALTFLRNAVEVEFLILDDDQILATLATENLVRKHHQFSNGYTIFDKAKWDGKVDGDLVKDGLYYYVIRAKIDHDNVDWQEYKFPVHVDTTAPDIIDATFIPVDMEVKWTAEDTGSGLASLEIIINNEETTGLLSPNESTYTLEHKPYQIEKLELVATDWAGNKETKTIFESQPNTGEMINLVDYLSDDQEIDKDIYQHLMTHLQSTKHFEVEKKAEKVVKHMNGFGDLIKQYHINGNMTQLAYDILSKHTQLVIEEWND